MMDLEAVSKRLQKLRTQAIDRTVVTRMRVIAAMSSEESNPERRRDRTVPPRPTPADRAE